MIDIIIHGCCGKMGRVLADTIAAGTEFNIVAGIDAAINEFKAPFPLFRSLAECDRPADVVIDFSAPGAIKGLLEDARRKNIPVIIATTGHTEEDKKVIQETAESLPVFQSANMSLGINLMTELIKKTSAVLEDDFDIEIVEKHHNLKKDAPSGTAYMLADAVSGACKRPKQYVFGRHSRDAKRQSNDIGIHAVRGGTIVGEHTVLFAGKDEILEIKHAARSRQVFAVGVLQAARYMRGKSSGFYCMQDMIAEQSIVTNFYISEEDALIAMHAFPHDSKRIAALFQEIAEKDIVVDMISQTAPTHERISFSFTIPMRYVEEIEAMLKSYQTAIENLVCDIRTDITKFVVEGTGMKEQSGVAARVFQLMASEGIPVYTVTTSETKIAYIIPKADGKRAADAVKSAFGI